MKVMHALTWIAVASVSVLGACDDDDEIVPIGAPIERCFVRTDLLSNVEGVAERRDPRFVDARGLTAALNVFTVVAAGADALAAVNADGSIPISELPRSQPIGAGYTGSAVRNNTLFLANEQGFISLINVKAEPRQLLPFIDRSATGASYTGIAAGDDFLLAADFSGGRIDVFDPSGALVLAPAFVDPSVPAGFAPFNVAVLDGVVFVTYAQTDGGARGFVSAFAQTGQLLWTSGGDAFDAPWGMAIAPNSFGNLGGTLLVANHASGEITVLDRATGTPLSRLPILIDGVWGIATGFGVGGSELRTAIYFTAGPAQGAEGLYGIIEFDVCL